MSIATVVTDGFGSFGTTALVVTLGFGIGNAAPAAQETFSGGYAELPLIKRRRTVQEERERLGIIPKAVKKAIKQAADASVDAEKTPREAHDLLRGLLAKNDIQVKRPYLIALDQAREEALSRDIERSRRIKARIRQQEDEDDDELAAEMLLL